MPHSTKVASNLVITSPSSKSTEGGLVEFKIRGKFIHFNTVEEYNSFEFNHASIKSLGIEGEIKEAAEKQDNFFVLACFGDLKTYKFSYKMGLV